LIATSTFTMTFSPTLVFQVWRARRVRIARERRPRPEKRESRSVGGADAVAVEELVELAVVDAREGALRQRVEDLRVEAGRTPCAPLPARGERRRRDLAAGLVGAARDATVRRV